MYIYIRIFNDLRINRKLKKQICIVSTKESSSEIGPRYRQDFYKHIYTGFAGVLASLVSIVQRNVDRLRRSVSKPHGTREKNAFRDAPESIRLLSLKQRRRRS